MRGKWKIQQHVGANIYRFGDWNLLEAVENVDLPIAVGNNFSLKSPWKGQATVDFKNDQSITFGD